MELNTELSIKRNCILDMYKKFSIRTEKNLHYTGNTMYYKCPLCFIYWHKQPNNLLFYVSYQYNIRSWTFTILVFLFQNWMVKSILPRNAVLKSKVGSNWIYHKSMQKGHVCCKANSKICSDAFKRVVVWFEWGNAYLYIFKKINIKTISFIKLVTFSYLVSSEHIIIDSHRNKYMW